MTSGLGDDRLTVEDVAAREFAKERKGYDRAEVRAFLQLVASALEDAAERVADLQRRLVRATVDSGGSLPDVEEVVLEAVSAEAWRDDVLADLDRRRRELNAEIVRLRAGRDRLRMDLSEVLSGVDEQLRQLDGALVAARAAGDLEEQKARDKSPLTVEESRAELEAARLAGFVTVGSETDDGSDGEVLGTADVPAVPADADSEVPDSGDVSAVPANAGTGDPDSADVLEEDAGGVGALFERLRAERTPDRPVPGGGGAVPEGG